MKNIIKPVMDILNSLFREGFEKFGRYYSSYRGYVVDNNDPDKLSRLKLVIPQITGKESMEYWVWPKNHFSGKDYGSQVIPQKGDMVWVEFEMGNPRAPIWQHGHFGFSSDGKTNEKPANLQDVKNFWFKTPGGHTIELDDTKKKITITPKDKFLVGDKDVTEKAVLGNKLKTKLEALCDKSQSMATKISTLTVNTSVGPSSPPTTAAEFTQLALDYAEIKSQLNEILSELMLLK